MANRATNGGAVAVRYIIRELRKTQRALVDAGRENESLRAGVDSVNAAADRAIEEAEQAKKALAEERTLRERTERLLAETRQAHEATRAAALAGLEAAAACHLRLPSDVIDALTVARDAVRRGR